MPAPSGFTYVRRSSGEIVITHHGRPAGSVRGAAAERLWQKLDGADDEVTQHVLARVTGNYKRGNERRGR
jgi:hypothetical protein